MNYGGGKVAYILQPDDSGYNAYMQHGIIVANSDLSSGVQWGCYGTLVGASGSSVGSGASNTAVIISSTCYGAGSAAYLCDTFSAGGYTDWCLPSTIELSMLCTNKRALGGFSNERYWTSSETLTIGAAFWDFSNNTGDVTFKSSLFRVRAIRYF